MAGALERAVSGAIRDLAVQPKDSGTAALAKTYAKAIDAGEPLEKLGPLLLACLESLLMTPRARAALVKRGSDGDDGKPASPVDEIRERRERRARAHSS
jgi:hypothetical protein